MLSDNWLGKPDNLFMFLLNVDVLYQLTLFTMWRLSEAWHSKRPSLVEAVKLLLDEQNLVVRKALSEALNFVSTCLVRLHFLGKLLSVERANKTTENNTHQQAAAQSVKHSSSMTKDAIVTRITRYLNARSKLGSLPTSEPIAERFGVGSPFPAHLDEASDIPPVKGVAYTINKYAYPTLDRNILTNIENALIAMPRFYTQVMTHAAKLNFIFKSSIRLLIFHLLISINYIPSESLLCLPLHHVHHPHFANKPSSTDLSRGESELESSDEQYSLLSPCRSMSCSFWNMSCCVRVQIHSAYFLWILFPEMLIVWSQLSFWKLMIRHILLERIKRESIVGPADVAHEAVGVRPASLVPKEIPVITKKNLVLQNYAAWNPASVLYIKNLVKDVVADDFYFIFGLSPIAHNPNDGDYMGSIVVVVVKIGVVCPIELREICEKRFADASLNFVDIDLIVVQCLLSVKLELISQILRNSLSGWWCSCMILLLGSNRPLNFDRVLWDKKRDVGVGDVNLKQIYVNSFRVLAITEGNLFFNLLGQLSLLKSNKIALAVEFAWGSTFARNASSSTMMFQRTNTIVMLMDVESAGNFSRRDFLKTCLTLASTIFGKTVPRLGHCWQVLCYLAPLFPKNINLFWQDEIPKMKAHVSDTEDLKQDPSYQHTRDDIIIHDKKVKKLYLALAAAPLPVGVITHYMWRVNMAPRLISEALKLLCHVEFIKGWPLCQLEVLECKLLAESLDVIQDTVWVISLGNAFAKQYELYKLDDEHIALLHRFLFMFLIWKVSTLQFVEGTVVNMRKEDIVMLISVEGFEFVIDNKAAKPSGSPPQGVSPKRSMRK
ncbi:hypothetical protein RHMOL_Rhmol03G0123600 [Rhododendron molle]|uniref:Uncharacterized protein n=1 Tax=Rhododendron molle TaxID=49168 RepID=A0ACC0PDQ2_RHOML|nr:hypothetical protein RHMOL_Rhmol03G0123600 [Rhododendron molle]